MRNPPKISPPEVTPKKQESIITQVREYRLITPLFGGGVEKAEADPVTIIRGTEIRGQLRFWWRACRTVQYETVDKMKKKEDEIWGAASKKPAKNKDTNEKKEGASSRRQPEETVQIVVEQISEGTPDTPFEKNGREKHNQRIAPIYAAFPLQPSDDDKGKKVPPKDVQQNVKFKLTISFPKTQKEEIEATLWAWETFGGIGARTRRGFGALQLLKVDNKDYTDLPYTNNVRSWIVKKLNNPDYIATGTASANISHLSPDLQFKVTDPFQDAWGAWNFLISRLSNFRQSRQKGRTGRSNWPEAETIRDITGDRDSKYSPLSHSHKFPRAAFGLPIIFHFRDDDTDDPYDTTLQRADKEKERLASPLILRPFICKDGKAVGLALLLEGRQAYPDALELVNKNKQAYPVTIDTKLTPVEAKNIPALDGETDVLKAFINSFGG